MGAATTRAAASLPDTRATAFKRPEPNCQAARRGNAQLSRRLAVGARRFQASRGTKARRATILDFGCRALCRAQLQANERTKRRKTKSRSTKRRLKPSGAARRRPPKALYPQARTKKPEQSRTRRESPLSRGGTVSAAAHSGVTAGHRLSSLRATLTGGLEG
jgi:hypothetical protein